MTNSSVYGYLIKSCEDLGMSEEQIENLMQAMKNNMNFIEESEAETIYYSSNY